MDFLYGCLYRSHIAPTGREDSRNQGKMFGPWSVRNVAEEIANNTPVYWRPCPIPIPTRFRCREYFWSNFSLQILPREAGDLLCHVIPPPLDHKETRDLALQQDEAVAADELTCGGRPSYEG